MWGGREMGKVGLRGGVRGYYFYECVLFCMWGGLRCEDGGVMLCYKEVVNKGECVFF